MIGARSLDRHKLDGRQIEVQRIIDQQTQSRFCIADRGLGSDDFRPATGNSGLGSIDLPLQCINLLPPTERFQDMLRAVIYLATLQVDRS